MLLEKVKGLIPKAESRSQNEGIDDTEEDVTENVSVEGDISALPENEGEKETADGHGEPEKDITEESVSKEVEEGETIWTLTHLLCQRRSGRDR